MNEKTTKQTNKQTKKKKQNERGNTGFSIRDAECIERERASNRLER
jgi:hypothetical protein